MKSVNKRLLIIRDALNTTSAAVYHYKRPSDPPESWIVWQEDGSNTDMWANNRVVEQQLHGTIDFYSRNEFDPIIDEIQEALNSVTAGWSLQMVDYEDETNLIHYEWEWNI